MRLGALAAALVLGLAFGPAFAQDDLSMGQVRSPVLIIDVDRLLSETQYGLRMRGDLTARVEALAAENRRIEAELTAEERGLTERRPTMEVEEFRAEAEAFDARVQRIRAEQDAKEQALNDAVEQGRAQFLNAASPVFAQLMIDSGAAVILERRDVFLSASPVDITDKAISAIDAQLGEGTSAPAATTPPPAATGTVPQGEAGGGEAPVAPAPPGAGGSD